jgi:hypothetical protein
MTRASVWLRAGDGPHTHGAGDQAGPHQVEADLLRRHHRPDHEAESEGKAVEQGAAIAGR